MNNHWLSPMKIGETLGFVVETDVENDPSEMTLLPSDYHLGPFDVLCGRGKKCFKHSGNQLFRKIIQDSLAEYTRASTKSAKTSIIRSIITQVRSVSKNGGFIKHDPLTGRYYEIGDTLAREKTSQAFRDALYAQDKPSHLSIKRPTRRNGRINASYDAPEKMWKTDQSGSVDTMHHSSAQSICLATSFPFTSHEDFLEPLKSSTQDNHVIRENHRYCATEASFFDYHNESNLKDDIISILKLTESQGKKEFASIRNDYLDNNVNVSRWNTQEEKTKATAIHSPTFPLSQKTMNQEQLNLTSILACPKEHERSTHDLCFSSATVNSISNFLEGARNDASPLSLQWANLVSMTDLTNTEGDPFEPIPIRISPHMYESHEM